LAIDEIWWKILAVFHADNEHSSLLVTVGLIVVIYIRLSDAEK
jgi:hypothetical protein